MLYFFAFCIVAILALFGVIITEKLNLDINPRTLSDFALNIAVTIFALFSFYLIMPAREQVELITLLEKLF